ncbi:MAG: hypothetical protein ABSB15_14080 [Bryobacteraceae bacterium]|jgi:hypothetical protein
MGSELRTYLEDMEARTNVEMQRPGDRIAAVIAAEFGKLRRDMQSGFARVDERLSHLTERLDRQGFILEGGIKALGGLLEHVATRH